ncbi:PspC domain-containing protein [Tsukamurella sp. 8F]|uniref:PspC domain-containing protein n=1 Tax=unclassified Tsukamurella TaxID=2633480 RepID=UPI0023B9BBF0|nr:MULTISPECIES: PspC domain-containing protein [unclassified Tsukamurella]MDF0532174.1 PspC domain-containing protein [Tsukamurella sp. 8J]MDF0587985.1 PspC domain-containing protein [Tsukamurella sp. 8F]
MSTGTFQAQASQMWETRPLRARQAPFAGVCTGFARRYGVDVTLIRAAVIAATVLGGAGIIAYIAGMIVLPKEGEATPVRPGPRIGPPPVVLAIAVGIAVIAGGAFGPSWPGSGIVSGLLLIAGWYALHQRRPVPPPGTSIASPTPAGAYQPAGALWQPGGWTPPWSPWSTWPPQQNPGQGPAAQPGTEGPAQPGGAHEAAEEARPEATATTGEASSGPDLRKHTAPQPPVQEAQTDQVMPPRWDPLGAAPFAWDLPEPAVDMLPEPLPRRRSRVTAVTLGLALIVAAALAAMSMTGVLSLSPVTIAAVTLGVVGAGLVAGAFARSGYGLLAVAIPLAGFVVIGTTAQNALGGFQGTFDGPRGDRTFTVTDATQLRPSYDLGVGSLTLDLRELTLDTDRTVTTHVGVGDTRIEVPKSMNVKVDCNIRMGDAQCPDGLQKGTNADGPTLTIDANGNIGQVEVRHE